MPDDEDEQLTPVETPDAKRKSGEHRMGDVPCPKCGGALVPCTLCDGRRCVGLSVAVAWTTEHGE